MTAQTGLRTEFKRKETLGPIIVGVGVVAYAVLGVLTFAAQDGPKFLYGAVTGLLAALVAIFFAVKEAKSGKLRWQ